MSSTRNYPICPVVLIDHHNPAGPGYPMSIAAVRHVFEELAQRVPPNELGFAVQSIEQGYDYQIPGVGIALGRLTEPRRESLAARGLRWCPDHGLQRIGAATETP